MLILLVIMLIFLSFVPDYIIVVCTHESFIPSLSDEVLASLPENQVTEWNPGFYYGDVPVAFMNASDYEYSDANISVVDYGR